LPASAVVVSPDVDRDAACLRRDAALALGFGLRGLGVGEDDLRSHLAQRHSGERPVGSVVQRVVTHGPRRREAPLARHAEVVVRTERRRSAATAAAARRARPRPR
jgi:hypothetical protein